MVFGESVGCLLSTRGSTLAGGEATLSLPYDGTRSYLTGSVFNCSTLGGRSLSIYGASRASFNFANYSLKFFIVIEEYFS